MLNRRFIFLTILTFLFLSPLTAKEDFSQSIKEKKIYPMGKKIYHKMCNNNIELKKYATFEKLKDSLKNDNLCRELKTKNLEALSLYLWEVERVSTNGEHIDIIKIHKDEKCQICGMFVYKYPKWATQIFYKNETKEEHYSFDGMKDLMKFYFENHENISKILVRDYYSQKVIRAKSAYFVVGSDVYGVMGNEFIAFKLESDAKTFYMDHKGAKILKFKDITKKEVYE